MFSPIRFLGLSLLVLSASTALAAETDFRVLDVAEPGARVRYRVLPGGALEITGRGLPGPAGGIRVSPVASVAPSMPGNLAWALSSTRLYPSRYYELFFVPEETSGSGGFRSLKNELAFSWDKGGQARTRGVDSMVVPTPEETTRMVEALAPALDAYPEPALRASGLRRIVLVKDLARSGARIHGTGGGDTIHFDLDATRSERWGQQVLHHEVGHVLDSKALGWNHREWERLNPEGFRYLGRGYRGVRRRAGFVRSYGMSSAAEDFATVYAAMVTRPGWVKAQVRSDEALRGKVRYVQRTLREFDPAFGGEFWSSVSGQPGALGGE